MNSQKIKSVLKEVLKKINPSKEELGRINSETQDFLKKVKEKIKGMRLDAEVFIGGSFAKKTIIKKGIYDVDIFVRFGKKSKDISGLTEKILDGFNAVKIKGSRNYFRVDRDGFFMEIIPVLKIKKPESAENVTDLSYFHVRYIKRKLKGKILDEVKIAKAFCHANGCYGAESYVKGFSGYALELLIQHYGSFLKFIKALEKINRKEVIDIERHFKNRNESLMNINESKIQSPVVLIDPTYKERNVLAALSNETFEIFRKACRKFLKNPSLEMFEKKDADFEKNKAVAKKKKLDFILVEIKTEKQEGDIAGTKLLKFYNHLNEEIEKFYIIKNREFEYNGEKTAKCFFAVKSREKILIKGPRMNQKENIQRFKKTHRKTFVKSGRIFSKEKINFNLKQFIEFWKQKNQRKMNEMSVSGMEIY
ncbi:MAG TPA: nucleotidyltransferase domain-containing protein [Candidatus Nanoarchaeia archaeon]|nr:nucleotidyltransferase domain-containing protein [Candidatus Nanoarchaeia archaeon]